MKLFIQGHEVNAKPNESLLEIITELGLVSKNLSNDPLVAKIAGRIFTLNFIPVKEKTDTEEKHSIRKAIAASDGTVKLLTYNDPRGRDAYTRTAQFIIFLAFSRLWPNAQVKMSCNVGAGLYFKVINSNDFSADKLKAEVINIVNENFVLKRSKIPTNDAIAYYLGKGIEDKARLLSYRTNPNLNVYTKGDFMDYYYGEMAPSTGYLRSWDIAEAEGGFVFVYPDITNPNKVSPFPNLPNLLHMYRQGKNWCELMECETVADLNNLVETGRVRELIRVNEALHEIHFSNVADLICERGAKAVLLSGPSSSGKTTSANRLAIQLRVHGKKPILMSLDDYYVDREKIIPDKNGKIDLEHINTIDTELFKSNLLSLFKGEEVELPSFNFKKEKREWNGKKLKLENNSVIIIEGLHALNPILLPENLDKNMVFKLYVSPLLPLNLDNHNRIPASYLRLLRRIVRDYETRNSSVQKTLSMWDSVRRGEERWIFPFQENADVIFNSSTLYELAVLKKHIFPLLTAIEPNDECYDEVRAIVKVLNYVHVADVDDEIPPTSLVREFIGGNAFYKNN